MTAETCVDAERLPISDALHWCSHRALPHTHIRAHPSRAALPRAALLFKRQLPRGLGRMGNTPHDLAQGLVLARALVGDLAQEVVLGPGEVDHFHDHLWPH